jgi:sugar-specific transcriptional regulator TrmB
MMHAKIYKQGHWEIVATLERERDELQKRVTELEHNYECIAAQYKGTQSRAETAERKLERIVRLMRQCFGEIPCSEKVCNEWLDTVLKAVSDGA